MKKKIQKVIIHTVGFILAVIHTFVMPAFNLLVKLARLGLIIFVFIDLVTKSVDAETAVTMGILILGELVDITTELRRNQTIEVNIVDKKMVDKAMKKALKNVKKN